MLHPAMGCDKCVISACSRYISRTTHVEFGTPCVTNTYDRTHANQNAPRRLDKVWNYRLDYEIHRPTVRGRRGVRSEIPSFDRVQNRT
jgi:hypothetical protein